MKKGLKNILLLAILFMFPILLNAASFKPTLTCPDSAAPGETISCTITANIDNIMSIQGNNSLGQSTYDSFEFSADMKKLQNSSSETSFIVVESQKSGDICSFLSGDATKKSCSINIGTLKVKLPNSAGPYYLSIEFRGTNAEDLSTVGKTTLTSTIKQKSTDSTLKSLSVEGMTLGPNFSPSITNYSLPETDAESIKIVAVANDSTAKITGAGTVKLDYGSNTKTVTVTSSAGTKTNYIIKVTRTDMRESINTLKSLSVKGYTLTPEFKPETLKYTLSVDNSVSKVTVEATVDSKKSSFVKNYGPRTVTLKYGKNEIKVKVQAENGTENTYTIDVTRKDSRESNNYLATLSLSKGTISFNKQTTSYTVNLDNSISEITISAEADSSKAKVTGTGTKKLNEGTNKFSIIVTAENEEKRTYTVVVNRGKSTHEVNETTDTNETTETNETVEKEPYIKSLVIKNSDIVFDPSRHTYTVKLKEGETKLDILYQVGKDYSSNLEGNNDLKDGSVVKLTISDGTENIEYIFNIKISNVEEESSSNNNLILYIAIGLLALVVIGILLSIFTKEHLTPEQVVQKKYVQESNRFVNSRTLIEGVNNSQVSGSIISQVEKPNSMTDEAHMPESPKKQEVQHTSTDVETLDFDPVTPDDINDPNKF